MKRVGHFIGRIHGDIVRQQAVEPVAKGPQRQVALRPEMRRHGAGVHTGIGTPGRVQPHRLAEQFRQGPLDHFLDAAAVRLQLPAGKIGTVVFENQQNGTHLIVPK